MRSYSFSWVIIMLVFMLSITFLAASPTITGHSVIDPAKSFDVPVYVSTFIVLVIIFLFVLVIIAGMSFHAKRKRIKEEESFRELIKNLK